MHGIQPGRKGGIRWDSPFGAPGPDARRQRPSKTQKFKCRVPHFIWGCVAVVTVATLPWTWLNTSTTQYLTVSSEELTNTSRIIPTSTSSP
jgi:hypothetical protein